MIKQLRSRSLAAAGCLAGLLLAMPAQAQSFAGCLAGIRADAAKQGVSTALFDRIMDGVAPDPKIIELMNNQPEFRTPIWDYLATLVDDEKIAQGRAMLQRWSSVLAAAEQKYGVDRHTIVAVWGVESDYGNISGRWSLPQSLSTLACTAPRRRDYFRGELIAALRIVARGDIAAEKLTGSWAGAFGHTQFMPSTYLRLAVDGDGDGRRDLVSSIPDALHSTANFMRRAGWVTGAPWGYEVRIPAGYSGPSGRRDKQPVSAWAGRGIVKIDGGALTGSGSAGLLLPAGKDGPAFLVFKNYDAAFAYNGADSYALAISLLADRLRGRPGIRTAWPTDDRGLSRAERRDLQKLLLARGYAIGEPDGAIGPLTRGAIRDFEAKAGLPPVGRAGGRVYDALRSGR